MFDLSALPLPTASQPVLAQPQPNTGNPAESSDAAPALAFDALLALQTAVAEPANATLPDSGKILPDAAKTVAALPQVPGLPAIAPAKQPSPQRSASLPEQATEDDDETGSGPGLTLPDPALIAAIFAAPERLADGTAQTDAVSSRSGAAALPQAPTAPQAATKPALATVALASAAQMELAPQQEPAPSQPTPQQPNSTVATSQIVTARQSRPGKSTGLVESAAGSAPATPSPHPSHPASELQIAAAEDEDVSNQQGFSGEGALRTNSPVNVSHVRTEARPERIDFATLVDTLARAREEASPKTVNVAVSHTEFGRVSLRFEHDDDRGMSVAMTSADPGFAPAVATSSEAARTSGETGGQSAQAQAEPRAQSGQQGENGRQQPRQAEQAGTTLRAAPRSTAETSDDDAARNPRGSGIYA